MDFSALQVIQQRIGQAMLAAGTRVRLLAVSKRQPDSAVRELAAMGQIAFGENYVQALVARRRVFDGIGLEWHLIGALQSNKCRLAALHADWVQSVDRPAIVSQLARFRSAELPPLNVLVEVNIDDESSKSGCAAADLPALCEAIAAQPRLRLRGLMAIPDARSKPDARRSSFARMRRLFDKARDDFTHMDTLSMGMSDDFELAIAEGATMVRVGTALFGTRSGQDPAVPTDPVGTP